MTVKKIIISKIDIKEFHIKFPNGKIIQLDNKNSSYTTSDQEEIDFASRQKGLAIIEVSDKEFRNWVQKEFDKKPHVFRANIDDLNLDEFNQSSLKEAIYIQRLKDKGYYVNKDTAELQEDFVKVLADQGYEMRKYKFKGDK